MSEYDMSNKMFMRTMLVYLSILFSLGCPIYTRAQLDPGLLTPIEAFKIQETFNETDILVHITIAKGCYLYKNKFHLEFLRKEIPGAQKNLEEAMRDASLEFNLTGNSVRVDDPVFGNTVVYKADVTIKIKRSQLPKDAAIVVVTYQGSWGSEIVYTPQKYYLNLAKTNYSQPND